MFNLVKKMHLKTTMVFHCTPNGVRNIKSSDNSKSCCGCREYEFLTIHLFQVGT